MLAAAQPAALKSVRLERKTAIVTGGATGIGKSIALALSTEGANVVIDYYGDASPANKLVAEIESAGSQALAVRADVSQAQDVASLVGQAVAKFGSLDIMVNNAGVEEKHAFLETPLEVWNNVLAVNLTGPWLGSQHAARQMVKQARGGRIINISSIHEDVTMPTNAPYCAAKGGLRMLMRTIAVELAPYGITVNNIAPGAVETPMDAGLKQDPKKLQALLGEIPLRRMAKPDEVARLCAFLASDDGAYITGASYFIDGGMSKQSGSL